MKCIMNIKTYLVLLLSVLAVAACSDWTDIEPQDIDLQDPSQQDPTLWARYLESLRQYKLESEHYLTYGVFACGAQASADESCYLRSLPDSLDFVAMDHSDRLTAYDREDIPLLQQKSTRMLYRLDYAAQADALTDANRLGAWVDEAVSTAAELQLDGFALTGIPLYGGTEAELTARREAAALIVQKLSTTGKVLVFEGDPAFLDHAGCLEQADYVVLNTAETAHAVDLKLYVSQVLQTYADRLPKERLLLAANIGSGIVNEENQQQDAVTDMTDRVVSLGHLGGLAIYSLNDDYQPVQMNYQTTRTAIQLLNPSR